jgi:peptide/nickel transport system substrate-binding protein
MSRIRATGGAALDARSRVAGIVFVALLATACSPAASGTPTTSSEPGGSASPATSSDGAGGPVQGGTVVHATDADPSALLPNLSTGVSDHIVSCKIYDALVSLDKNLEPAPMLAKEWNISDDGLTVTFTLQENVTFHDGTPMTSADVKFTFEEVVPAYAPQAGPVMERILESIDTPDETTVTFNLSEPYGPLMQMMGCPDSAIVPKHIFEGQDILNHPAALSEPIGTGPFKMGEWVRGQTLTLVRNENYWNQPYPYLDQIVYRISPDETARTLAFEGGEVDYINTNMLSSLEWQRLSQIDGVQAETGTSEPGFVYLPFNVTRAPFDDKLVRQAVMHAIDREAINEVAFGGLGVVSVSSIPPGIGWANNPDVDLTALYPHDPDRAAELLDEAGLTEGANGVRASVNLVFASTSASLQSTAEIIRENLREVGIEVELIGAEDQVAEDRVFVNHDFDMSLWDYTTRGDPTLGIERVYATRYVGTRSFQNSSGYSNPDVDELFLTAATRPETADRAAALFEVQEILADEVPTIPIIDEPSGDVAQSYVHGLWTEGSADNSNWSLVWTDRR